MKQSVKKFTAVFISMGFFILCYAQMPGVHSTKTTAEDIALMFAQNVIMLDMTKYDINLDSYSIEYPDKLAGRSREYITYTLFFENSILDMACVITENTLTYCRVRTVKGIPIINNSSTTILSRAKDLLQRYQIYKEDPSLEAMYKLLENFNELENRTTIMNNVKLEVIVEANSTSFIWRFIYNGAEYTGIDITFREGYIAFRDDRSIYNIGNTNVRISEQEAIAIALNRIENVSYKVRFANESWVDVSNLKVVKKDIIAQLATQSKEELLLYPYWNVLLPLDDVYPGYVWAFSVDVWANSGEVINFKARTTGGEVLSEQTHVTATESSLLNSLITVAVVFTVVITIAVMTIIVKKIHK